MCRHLLDSSEATVKELIRNAKKRGYVTVEQVSSALPRRRAIRSRSRIFGEMGVNVVETQEVRGLVSAHRRATGARNFTNCDSLLIGHHCGAHTVPYIEAKNSSTVFEHEATTSKISEDMLFYCRQRGLSADDATALVVNGFVKDVLQHLPMEFAVEAQKLISISLEGSVG
jgi:Fe-S cluster assembly scaffold protein SufB